VLCALCCVLCAVCCVLCVLYVPSGSTDLARRSVDLPQRTALVNYDLPSAVEQFAQRMDVGSGRDLRALLPLSVSLVTDANQLQGLQRFYGVTFQKLPQNILALIPQ
jgi:superfamily II DNA/RNA helicase